MSIGKFKNMKKQKGVFIYLDSECSLKEICDVLFPDNNPITYHLIPKPSLNYPDGGIHDIQSLYRFLFNQGICGESLFDDLQGFRFDLNYLSGK